MRIVTMLLFLLIGIGLAVGGAVVHFDHADLVERGTRTEGVVTSVDSSRDSEGDMSYTPEYTYVIDGVERTHKPNVSTSSQPTVGATETMYVDPDDPNNVLVDNFMGRWFVPVLLGGIGVSFMFSALISIAVMRRRMRDNDDWGSVPSANRSSYEEWSAKTKADTDSTSDARRHESAHSDSTDDPDRTEHQGPFL